MTLAERPRLGRISALVILASLIVSFCLGPVAAYCGWVAGNADALAGKAAVLERYRALAGADTKPAVQAGPSLLFAEMPESQATALLQETVKTAAVAARVQVQGLQVLRGEPVSGATRIGVRVRASGDTAGLRNLLYAIETARPLLYPDNLSVQSHAATPGAAASVLDFQFDVSGFKAEPAT